jgi:hypothetical protein
MPPFALRFFASPTQDLEFNTAIHVSTRSCSVVSNRLSFTVADCNEAIGIYVMVSYEVFAHSIRSFIREFHVVGIRANTVGMAADLNTYGRFCLEHPRCIIEYWI